MKPTQRPSVTQDRIQRGLVKARSRMDRQRKAEAEALRQAESFPMPSRLAVGMAVAGLAALLRLSDFLPSRLIRDQPMTPTPPPPTVLQKHHLEEREGLLWRVAPDDPQGTILSDLHTFAFVLTLGDEDLRELARSFRPEGHHTYFAAHLAGILVATEPKLHLGFAHEWAARDIASETIISMALLARTARRYEGL